MKLLLKQLMKAVIRVWSKVYTLKSSQKLHGYKSAFYTMWIANFIGKVGEGVSVHYPCLIQGGGAKIIFIGDGTTVHTFQESCQCN